jgi:hypothetical protein
VWPHDIALIAPMAVAPGFAFICAFIAIRPRLPAVVAS